MDKRRFLRNSLFGLSTIYPTISFAKVRYAVKPSAPAQPRHAGPLRPLIKPPRLREGDLVALFAPGGHCTDAQIERSFKNLESIGLKVKLSPRIRERYGGYAGRPQTRADDLHELMRDREVKALWSIRGGSGTAQILPLLDFNLIRAHPKIIIGFSDITALVNTITYRSGLITFHGPGAISTFSEYSKNHLLAVLFERQSNYVMRSAAFNDERAATEAEYQVRTLKPGVAEGPLWGGNLSVFSAMIGTPYLPSFKDALLFIEEVSEEPYRIDRMLTHVRQSSGGALPAATLFGVTRRYAPKDDAPQITLPEVLEDHAAAQPIPCVSGYSFGHISHQMTLPIGTRARLDTSDATLTLLQAAVRG